MRHIALPAGVSVLERGWLSANNIVFVGRDDCAVVDTGYCTHAAQTVALVEKTLMGRDLDRVFNTHLHSDHCGGNAALQARYPGVHTVVPVGLAQAVQHWDEAVLTYAPTGQECPRFCTDDVLLPGQDVRLADIEWQVHAAPGHDPHSIILFEPQSRTLVSADALWEAGFGVVFPELEGEDAFGDVGATLDLIESLNPAVVIPGHGKVFDAVEQALASARRRLEVFAKDPARHATHAAKVLLKFKLLDAHEIPVQELLSWANSTPYFHVVHDLWFADSGFDPWLSDVMDQLVRSKAADLRGNLLVNANR